MRREGPGPGKYVLPPTFGCKPHDPRKNKLPCYSIGQRLKEINDLVGPGPGKYAIEKYNRYGKEHFSSYMGHTLNPPSNDQVPAPNAYILPTSNVCARRQPSHSIGAKIIERYDTGVPGPNIYKLPKMIGPDTGPVSSTAKAPVYSMAKRLPTNDDSGTPGPKYLLKFVDQGKLPTTFKYRPIENSDNGVPGPKYNLHGHRPGTKSPAYSMRARLPDWVEPWIVPEDY